MATVGMNTTTIFDPIYFTNTSTNGSGGHHDGVHVISWNFDYVAEPLLVALFILFAGVLKLGFHYASVLSSIIPESCLLIIVGIAFGAILNAVGLDEYFDMSTRTFMLFLLPPIILDAAYSLNDRVFMENLGTILMFAVIGTVLNCFMLGPTLYGLAVGGAMGGLNISFIECLLFSSFIIAVDPVAVLAIFQEVGVNNVLYFLVFGESLLNDAVTVVLYNTMKAFVDMDEIPGSQMALGVASFFTVSCGGLLIGLVFGVLTALFTRTTGHVRVVEPLALIILAYLSYLCAELVHWSGIIATIGCGLMQAQYAFHNISRKSYITVKYFMKMLSSVMDAIIFLFLGIEIMRNAHHWNTAFVCWSMFYCLVFRFITVFGLGLIANCFRPQRIKFEEQFIMWYGGLRGAVCFALCDTLRKDFRHRGMFLTTTFFIIFFTVFVQGMTIKPLVALFKITRKSEEKETMNEEIHGRVTDHLMSGMELVVGEYGHNRFRSWLMNMNDRYFKTWFQVDPMSQDEKLLQAYGKIVMKDYESNIDKDYLHPKQDEMYSKFYMKDPGISDSPISPDAGMKRVTAEFEERKRHSVTPGGYHAVPLIVEAHDHRGAHDSILRRRPGSTSSSGRGSSVIRSIVGSPDVTSEVPSMGEIKQIFNMGKAPSTKMHQKYDPALRNDDELDILHQLQLHHERVERYKRTSIRNHKLSYNSSQESTETSPTTRRRQEFAKSPKLPTIPSGTDLVGTSVQNIISDFERGGPQNENVQTNAQRNGQDSTHIEMTPVPAPRKPDTSSRNDTFI